MQHSWAGDLCQPVSLTARRQGARAGSCWFASMSENKARVLARALNCALGGHTSPAGRLVCSVWSVEYAVLQRASFVRMHRTRRAACCNKERCSAKRCAFYFHTAMSTLRCSHYVFINSSSEQKQCQFVKLSCSLAQDTQDISCTRQAERASVVAYFVLGACPIGHWQQKMPSLRLNRYLPLGSLPASSA